MSPTTIIPVWRITFGEQSFVTDQRPVDPREEGETITETTMERAAYEALAEFNGF